MTSTELTKATAAIINSVDEFKLTRTPLVADPVKVEVKRLMRGMDGEWLFVAAGSVSGRPQYETEVPHAIGSVQPSTVVKSEPNLVLLASALRNEPPGKGLRDDVIEASIVHLANAGRGIDAEAARRLSIAYSLLRCMRRGLNVSALDLPF
jgi:hypothetical protein